MKQAGTGAGRFRIVSFVYRVLLAIVLLLGLLIISGTVYGMFFRVVPAGDESGAAESGAIPRNAGEQGKGLPFTAIGHIRASTADIPPYLAVLSVSFIYYPDDKAFAEELALRVSDFRDVVRAYIGSFTAAELQKTDEETIKTELLRKFNAILRLGQIETLYFSDFMIVG